MPRRVNSSGRPVYARPNYGRTTSRRPRFKLPRLSRRGWRSIVVVAASMGVVGVLSYQFRVRTIIVSGTSRSGEVRTKTEQILRRQLWWGNLMTLDTAGLAAAIQRTDPAVRQVSVKRQWPQGIIVIGSDKRPSLVWDTGGERYLIDADGTTISRAEKQGAGLPVVRDQSNLPTEPGKAVVSASFVNFVATVAAALPLQGIKLSGIEVHETTLDVYFVTDRNYQLIFDSGRGASDELADLRTVLKTLADQRLVPTSYIDLRVPGKAYYK